MNRTNKINLRLSLLSVLISCVFFLLIEDVVAVDDSIKETNKPIIKDQNFTVEEFISGLDWPTTMTFVGNDILVLEKNKGNVRLVRDGILEKEPVLTVNVMVNNYEQGLLGITSHKSNVYLYFTEKGSDLQEPGNNIYKYQWDGNQLIQSTLLKELPVDEEWGQHNGGAMTVDLDGNVYAVIGDIAPLLTGGLGILQNNPNGEPGTSKKYAINDTSVIFPVEPSGPYYAIGIRNSFGLTVDPVTGNIWDTENGLNEFDEINLVNPHFNSGWAKISGPAIEKQIEELVKFEDYSYSDPEFSWEKPIGITAILFVQSDLFNQYDDSVLVGDFVHGNIYEFKLDKNRTGFLLKDPSLADLVLNKNDSMREILFGINFQGVTDIKIGPDGFIYIISIGDGKIYRIVPSELSFVRTSEPNCNYKNTFQTNYSGCNFSGLNFQNVNLDFANLSKTNLSGANLRGASLAGTDLTGANLKNADLSNAKMKSVSLKEADLENAILIGANLHSADLENANLANADLTGANLLNSKLYGANLKEALLSKTNLYRVDLSGIDLSHADLSDADLTMSSFINSNLQDADLTGANLRHANLMNANLIDTDLQGAILGNVNLKETNLSGANLLNTYPWGTDFDEVIMTEETKINTCLEDNYLNKFINKILRMFRQQNTSLFEEFGNLLLVICN